MAKKAKEADRHKDPAVFARVARSTYDVLKRIAAEDRRSLGSLVAIVLDDYVAGKNGAKP